MVQYQMDQLNDIKKELDTLGDEKLSFNEVEVMCRRLGVRMGQDDLHVLFKVPSFFIFWMNLHIYLS